MINKKNKEYIIIFCGSMCNDVSNSYFKHVEENEFINIVNKLENENYNILKYSEE